MRSKKRPALLGKRDIGDGNMVEKLVMTDVFLFPSLNNFLVDDLVQRREVDNLSGIRRDAAFDAHPQFVLMTLDETSF